MNMLKCIQTVTKLTTKIFKFVKKILKVTNIIRMVNENNLGIQLKTNSIVV